MLASSVISMQNINEASILSKYNTEIAYTQRMRFKSLTYIACL